MSVNAYKSVDVDVFREIFDCDFFTKSKKEIPDLMELVKKIQTVELKIPGIDLDIKKETNSIAFKKYGFRAKTDFKIEFKQDVFENRTLITLIPQKVYELQDMVKRLPIPYCENGKKLLLLFGDAFERLKVRCKNILQNTINDKQIIHYATKNIQVALRNCYEARLYLIKIQRTKNRDAIFLAYMANVFMINIVSYLLKMFSSYYKDINHEKDKQKAELYDVMDLNVIMEPRTDYITKEEIKEDSSIFELPQFKLNIQGNQFITAIYDFLHHKTEDNLPAIEASSKDIQDLLHKIILDKKGKPLNKTTIKTCLSESRSDKRVKGNKRIDTNKYF